MGYGQPKPITEEDIARFNHHLRLCVDTGALWWEVATGSRSHRGNRAGVLRGSSGLKRYVQLGGTAHPTDRVAYAIHHRKELGADDLIRHTNGDVSDDRPCNLELVDRSAKISGTLEESYKIAADLQIDDLVAFFTYDPETGMIYHAFDKKNGKGLKGTNACVQLDRAGYQTVKIKGIRIKAHRAAWMLYHKVKLGTLEQIDHMNGDRLDNRITNLRAVDATINAQNRRRATTGNTSGLLGVCWDTRRKKWYAQIRVTDKNHNLGHFEDKHEAHQAYLEAKRCLHPGCTI